MVKRLKNSKSYNLPADILERLSQFSYVFNPSFVKHRDKNYMAIRVYDLHTNSILALVFIWNEDGKKLEVNQINLSDYFKLKLGFHKVADPKLFIMNDKVFGSCNTSHAMKDPNQLALFELNQEKIEAYFLCDYTERKKTEKNWAFFTENNELFALYSLEPLIIIKAVKENKHKITFEKHFIDSTQSFTNYSIGSPLFKFNNAYGFIAHKKYYNKGKRLYLGKPFIFANNDLPALMVGGSAVIHSFRSLLGTKFKFNKNLISCTYFSGIYKSGDNLILSYGINDVKWNLIIVKMKEIWP